LPCDAEAIAPLTQLQCFLSIDRLKDEFALGTTSDAFERAHESPKLAQSASLPAELSKERFNAGASRRLKPVKAT
jgi:hypothetical protein